MTPLCYQLEVDDAMMTPWQVGEASSMEGMGPPVPEQGRAPSTGGAGVAGAAAPRRRRLRPIGERAAPSRRQASGPVAAGRGSSTPASVPEEGLLQVLLQLLLESLPRLRWTGS